ncbi:GNAT family N-acetyltransferase [Sneathiella sp. P13V-1]|uniref:GNAT family N-acetyltransferase n=1 Tax=Sneathiella sp. P13V-1 TaxID=2697366 RepID=UPI00187BAAB1|nr:GNAT family N-acetyltransferase [Sneathiella sp. P13V-1]MBE7637887.1 GNAT family N-acetyltransferase [Sneathiella sp. P13V-1]
MSNLVTYKLDPLSEHIPAVLNLIQKSFAFMEGRIDPPSSMRRLSPESISDHCRKEEVWCIGEPPVACIFFTVKSDCLYVGKLAVDEAVRGQGLARELIELATARAKALGFDTLELQVRVELTENQTAFKKMGFVKTGEDAHEGYDRPTSFTMRKSV